MLPHPLGLFLAEVDLVKKAFLAFADAVVAAWYLSGHVAVLGVARLGNDEIPLRQQLKELMNITEVLALPGQKKC